MPSNFELRRGPWLLPAELGGMPVRGVADQLDEAPWRPEERAATETRISDDQGLTNRIFSFT